MKRLGFLVPVGLVVAVIAYVTARPARVSVSPATRGTAIEAVYATGTVEADPRVVVKAKVAGTISQLLVKEGDRVKAGQLLARIDNKTLAYDLQRTRADVRASTLRTSVSSPQLGALKAQRESISADVKLAEAELARAEALVKKGAMAQDELDRRRERLNKLKADWSAADARVASTEIDLRAERERLGAMEGAIASQNADADVRAPQDGTVIRRRVELGEAVTQNAPLFTVGNTDHLLLEVKIDEGDVGRVRLGQEVLVDLYAFADRKVTGKVVDLLPDADRDTKTFLGKVELITPPNGMRSGMSAEVNIVTDKHDNAVLVPAGAVASGKAFIVADGRVHERQVRTGLKDTRSVEVLSGVQPDEKVVLVGPKTLKDGDRITEVAAPVVEPERKPSQNQMTVR
jgi:RND family efflux transporter MFP subunit